MAEKRTITLAVARVINGKKHPADAEVTVTDLEARDLIRAGLARDPKTEPPAPAAVATPTTKGN